MDQDCLPRRKKNRPLAAWEKPKPELFAAEDRAAFR
jgi:hypothetical protein